MTKMYRRYPNRKFYCSESARYITHEAFRDNVHRDIDFRVIDHATQNDITEQTLLNTLVMFGKLELEQLKNLIKQSA